MENDVIVPIENSIYIIYHHPTKRSFKYDKIGTIPKIEGVHECERSMRNLHLQCQDTIPHRLPNSTGIEIHRTPLIT